MAPDTRILLANCAGSFLLLLAFLLLALAITGAFMLWRGLRVARRELPSVAARAATHVSRAERATQDTAVSVVEPQIRVASAWRGLVAGSRALVGLDRPSGDRGDGDRSAPL